MSESLPTDDRLYEKSRAAAKRYCGQNTYKRGTVAHAMAVVKFEMYRAGWMKGHRAGVKAAQRKRR